MLDNPLFCAVAVPAVILRGLAKGGFAGVGAIAMPLLALVIAPVQAAAIVLPVLIVQERPARPLIDARLAQSAVPLG